jgi:hypothetical protein
MEFSVGQVIQMKKKHPCGCDRWKVLRVGADFRLQCQGCGRLVMMPRRQVEKGVKKVLENPGRS